MKLRSKVRNLWSKIESWLRQVWSWLRREWFGIKPISSWIVPLMMNLWSKIESWLRQAWSWIAENRLIVIVVILFISGLVLFVHFLFINILGLYYILFYLGLQGDKPAYIIGSLWGFAAFLFGLHLRNRQLEQGNRQIDNFKEQLKQGHAQLEQGREHNLEDRYIRSVELTGNRELGVRLGGLAGLEALLHTNAEMYVRVWEYLGAFLRNPPDLEGWVTTQRKPLGSEDWVTIQHDPPDSPESSVITRLGNEEALFCRKGKKGESSYDKGIGIRPDIMYIAKMLRERKKNIEKWREWEKDFRLPLSGAHLENGRLTRVHLQRTILTGAHLQETDLSYANLQKAGLIYANLQGANLRGANLQEANLREANLQKADLSGVLGTKVYTTHLGEDVREESVLRVNLKGANLQYAKLQGAKLQDVNLQEANLRGANLQKADLSGAKLQEASLGHANLQEADLRGANLQKMKLSGIIIQKTTAINGKELQEPQTKIIPSVTLVEANLSEAKLQEASLSGANLQGVDLKETAFYKTDLTRTDLRDAKNLTREQLKDKECYYYYHPDDPDDPRYGPPTLPDGLTCEELDIIKTKGKPPMNIKQLREVKRDDEEE